MKKQASMFLTFSALLTFNAFAPQVFWQESKVARFPAEVAESKIIKDVELKKIDIDTSVLTKLPEVKVAVSSETRLEQIQDELDSIRAELKSGKLEDSKIDEKYAQIELLQDEAHAVKAKSLKAVEQKESSVKALAHEDLKVDKIDLLEIIEVKPEERAALNLILKHEDLKEIKIDKSILEKLPEVVACEYSDEQLEDKMKSLIAENKSIIAEIDELREYKREKKAKLAKKDEPKKREYKSDVLSIMSEFTNLMMSQQQMQMMMMQQMFSMMPQQQQRPMTLESLYGAHSYAPSRLEMSYTQYPLGYSRHEIGIDYVHPHGTQRFERAPSAQYEQRYMQQPTQMAQPLVEQAHDGFNFNQAGTSGMNRVYFN